ncbi:hypothetical protein [Morganella phage Mecenats66]|nr:hypothetical protein [Morganella phage Mecenats66]
MSKYENGDMTNIGASILAATGDHSYLGSPDVVSALVQKMFAEVCGAVAMRDDGDIDNNSMLRMTETILDRYAAIFAGKEPGYTPVPGWTEDDIGAWLLAVSPDCVPEDGTTTDKIKGFLAGCTTGLFKILGKSGSLTNSIKSEVDRLVYSTVCAITGLEINE